MVDIKIAIETYFNDNWTDTPIQWHGMAFTAPSDGKWIYVTTTPIDRAKCGFMNGGATNTAQIKVMSYGSTPNISLKLDDDIRNFLEGYTFANAGAVAEGIPDGLGTIDLDNGTFESSSLYLVSQFK